jgi:putative transposase
MARRLRIQFEGAIYHVINRGNYRRDVFETVGAAQAFEAVLGETCEFFGWRLHGYVVMRNHYHIALTTPQPNLAEGMHWLQSTFAMRFNRFRDERGHLFQGRYHGLLVENAAALGRVVNYIHLNPVRAKIVAPEQVGAFRWSSLRRLASGVRPSWLHAGEWLTALGFQDTAAGWRDYVTMLIELAGDAKAQEEMGFGEMSRGWGIGTHGWRKAMAKEYSHLAISPGIPHAELRDLKEARWTELLTTALRLAGKTAEEIAGEAKGASWKIEIARELRERHATPAAWIADRLNMGIDPTGSGR